MEENRFNSHNAKMVGRHNHLKKVLKVAQSDLDFAKRKGRANSISLRMVPSIEKRVTDAKSQLRAFYIVNPELKNESNK